MHPWFRWIFYLNPGAYAFEALMANEFGGLGLQCVSPQYVPYGGSYDNQTANYRGCTVLGADSMGMIDGATYIRDQYSYSTGHIWRGFGVLIGFWIFFLGVTALGFELRDNQGGSSVLLYKRSLWNKKRELDPEAQSVSLKGERENTQPLPDSQTVKQSTFTWHDLDYYVKSHGEKKQLLDKIFGFVQPGNLTALMGSSGAGKTTYVIPEPTPNAIEKLNA